MISLVQKEELGSSRKIRNGKNNTVENLDKIFKVAQDKNVKVFVSPHYYFPHDHKWKIEGAGEYMMHHGHLFDRKGQYTTEGFEGSGADWLE